MLHKYPFSSISGQHQGTDKAKSSTWKHSRYLTYISNLFLFSYSSCSFTVMLRAWRERNPLNRIKAAQEALEKGTE